MSVSEAKLAYAPVPKGVHPSNNFAGYRSTALRGPKRAPLPLPHTLSELTGPVFGPSDVRPEEADLTRRHAAEPQGQRIIVSGRVLDEDGRAVPNTLVEIWQCNAAGRYIHEADQHDAPLDPNFTGTGRTVTDADGHYKFITIEPGAYPWRNHANAWRPKHIHFSLFGHSFLSRVVTQMYFPGDPLFEFDPIFNSIPDKASRERLVSRFDMATTIPEWGLGYVWDIVLRGRKATPREA